MLGRKEVTPIRVILYGLMLSDHLLRPDMQVITCDDWSELENALLLIEPDLIVLHESVAAEALTWLSMHVPDVPVMVVVKDSSPRMTRYWTALGASQVEALKEWEKSLRSEQAELDRPQRPQNADESRYLHPPYSSHSDAVILAVAGVYGGVGVTHTALSLAHFLATQARVAVWEAGSNPCFDFLEYSLTGSMNRKAKFDLGRKLTLFKESASLDLVEFVAAEYSYLIYDLGQVQTEQQMTLLSQAHIPILVASAAPWRQVELVQFCRQHAQLRQDRWRFVFPHSDVVSSEMQECLAGRSAFALPTHADPARQDEPVIDALEAIVGITKSQKKKSWLRLPATKKR